jgi:hypothetical protein
MVVYLQKNKNRLPIRTWIILGTRGTRFLGEHTELCVELVLKSETALGDSPCFDAAADDGDEIAGVEGGRGKDAAMRGR